MNEECTVFECNPKGSESNLQKVFVGLQSWSLEKTMMLNPTKTKDMIVDLFPEIGKSTQRSAFHRCVSGKST